MAIKKSIYLESPGFGPDGFGDDLFYYNGTGETFYNDFIKIKGYKVIYNGKMKASHRITSRRFTTNYLKGRYAYYGLGDSFKLFRENNFLFYFFKIFLCTSKYIIRFSINLYFFHTLLNLDIFGD